MMDCASNWGDMVRKWQARKCEREIDRTDRKMERRRRHSVRERDKKIDRER